MPSLAWAAAHSTVLPGLVGASCGGNGRCPLHEQGCFWWWVTHLPCTVSVGTQGDAGAVLARPQARPKSIANRRALAAARHLSPQLRYRRSCHVHHYASTHHEQHRNDDQGWMEPAVVRRSNSKIDQIGRLVSVCSWWVPLNLMMQPGSFYIFVVCEAFVRDRKPSLVLPYLLT